MKIIKESVLKAVIAITFVLSGQFLLAQQQPEYTQYMYNTMVLNPAYAGSNGPLEVSLLHRSQWVGIEGAPKTQSFGLHGKLWKKVGLGLSAINDKIGPSNQFAVNAAFGYHLVTGQNTHLSLGVNIGMDVMNINWSKGLYYDPNDVILNDNINEVRPLVGAGAYFYSEKWYLGISVPSLLTLNSYDPGEEVVFQRRNHYYLMGGYVFNLSDQFRFKPAILGTVVEGSPISVDVSANFQWMEKFTFGVAHRFSDSVSALVGLQLAKSFFVGYAYDYSVSKLNKYNDGSHEIILKYTLSNKNQRARSPRFF
ncbi:MAG TPA: type IX secretion system membrane protein PorP/SprF [Arenibacter sp.]|nr:type IX secretion system membrane protein PorP/SprF [Arenibacter sp.]